MALSVEEIVLLYREKGSEWYGGEAVSQIEHALQTAMLAEREGASFALVAASFLHDVGHLLAHQAHEVAADVDDAHQYTALPFLRGAAERRSVALAAEEFCRHGTSGNGHDAIACAVQADKGNRGSSRAVDQQEHREARREHGKRGGTRGDCREAA
jgi:predicted HD phosphohydrolase